MKCAKCGALNAEGAEFCSFCYESFKPKAAAKAPSLIFPAVVTEFGLWETVGPLLITREAFYFLVEKCQDVSDRKTVKGQIKHGLMHQGLVGMAIGMAFNEALSEKMPLKPVEVDLKTIHWGRDPLQNFPEIRNHAGPCTEYFAVGKKDLTNIKVDLFSRFHLVTSKAEITTSSMEERDLITGFLRSGGYPLENH